ncbi:unnamed protein product [Taenia asiatica]|uniref:Uncharacterized protein n=1 Tax=Taenia asiatica TaxID=60517 RepID=A0A0R3WBE8_TAEAS|nr:unnamed protein product [Taenia asiatica]
MDRCEKDGRHDGTVSSDGCEDSIPSQEEHEEVNYDADDEGEEVSDEKEDTHSPVSVKNAPIGTLSNVVREVDWFLNGQDLVVDAAPALFKLL